MEQTCAHCPQPGSGTCFRCGQPVCTAHSPTEHERCRTCEEQYRARARVTLVGRAFVGAVVGLLTGVALVYLLGAIDLSRWFEDETRRVYVHVLVSLLSALVAGIGVSESLRRRARRRFLAATPSVPHAR